MTQLKRLAAHLGSGKHITPLEAKEVYGISRLAARVWDLNSIFLYPIVDRELRKDEAGKRYARYSVAHKGDQKMLLEIAKEQ